MDRTFAIVDDLLSSREHLDLWSAFQETVLSPARANDWNRTYRLTDGEEPVSSEFRMRKPSLQDVTPDGLAGPPALRMFAEKLHALMTADRPALAIDSWTGFGASAWVYRRGAGLEWHSDTGWLGGYIYYMHPDWRASWGGELLVADAAASSDGSRDGVEAVCRTGGTFVYPRPNRLVLLRGGTLHCVKKVESAAGDAFRASVSGFFFNTLVERASG